MIPLNAAMFVVWGVISFCGGIAYWHYYGKHRPWSAHSVILFFEAWEKLKNSIDNPGQLVRLPEGITVEDATTILNIICQEKGTTKDGRQ